MSADVNGVPSPDGVSSPSAHDLEGVTVEAKMRRGVVSCSADDPLGAVARRMVDEGIHCVAIYDVAPDGRPLKRPWGLITVLDLIRGTIADAAGDRGARAGDVALSPATAIYADDWLSTAAQRMAEFRTSHLLVLDRENDSPIGVIAGIDIAEVIADPLGER